MTARTIPYYWHLWWRLTSALTNGPEVFWKLLSKQPVTEIRLPSGLVFHSPANNTLWEIVEEICLNEVYTPTFLPLRANSVVVDVGANVGVFSIMAAQYKAAKRVIAIEPLPTNQKAIQENVTRNNCQSVVTIVPAALSNKIGTQTLHVGRVTSIGSLSAHDQSDEEISVPTITFSTLCREQNLDHIDLFKLDCEGEEGNILASLTPTQWRKISCLALEYHNHLSSLQHQEILDLLQAQGYVTKHVRAGDSPIGYIYGKRQ